jgi:hypothetical protein
MKTLRAYSRRFMIGTLAALVTMGAVGMTPRPASAHEATCPYCKLDVVQDTRELDNEVALKYGRKRIEYRCVFCALAQAHTEFKGDLTILAPSEVKGKPVLITRKEGKWSVSPETAVFVGHKVNHRKCQLGYRALTSKAGYDAWIKQNQKLLADAKPLNLEQMVKLSDPAAASSESK